MSSELDVSVIRLNFFFVLSTENYGETSTAVSGDDSGIISDPSVLTEGEQLTCKKVNLQNQERVTSS